jgi:nucleotide sugar dehydrogenase
MRVTVIGAGKLGLSYAAFIASHGHSVHCVDNNTRLIEDYVNGIFDTNEPKVAELASRYPMTYSTEPVPSDVTIVLVNTPTSYAGYDHDILESVLNNISGNIIVTCTVQPGFFKKYPNVVYNPLFVQIGNIVTNLESTESVLIGGPSGVHSDFFKSIYGETVNLHYMSHIEAEVAKLALNSYITMKISFANMIGDALRRAGAEADAVLDFVGSDKRVGNRCLKYGWGYGGPCFPRDNRALCTFLREYGVYDYLPVASHESNERHAVEQALFTPDVFTNMCYKDDCDVPITEESHKVKTALIKKSMGKKINIQFPPDALPKELHPFCQM